MQRTLCRISGILFMASISTGFAQAPETEEEQPKAEAVEELFDFGEIYEGEKIQHVFKIKNAGTGVLKIFSMHASCGCTAAVVSDEDKELAQGEEGEVKVTFHSASKKGRQNRIVTVKTNDPVTPQLKLSLQGFVKQRVVVEPSSIRFGDVERGAAPKEMVVTLEPMDNTPFEIEEISSGSQMLSWECKERDGGGYEIKVILTVEKDVPPASLHDAVNIKTTHPGKRTVRVPVIWCVVSGIRVHPKAVALLRRGDQRVEATFTMTKPEGGPFKIKEITKLPEFVSYTTELLHDERSYKVKLVLDDDVPLGRYGETIIVKTDDPENSEIPVQLFVRVEPEAHKKVVPSPAARQLQGKLLAIPVPETDQSAKDIPAPPQK